MTAERARIENKEQENSPEQAVATGVLNAELRDATNLASAPETISKAKKFFENPAVQSSVGVASIITRIAFKTIWSLLKFSREAITSKGKIGFSKGYEIGSEVFSFDGKKDKKS